MDVNYVMTALNICVNLYIAEGNRYVNCTLLHFHGSVILFSSHEIYEFDLNVIPIDFFIN